MDRQAELEAIERFLAEKGATHCPPVKDPALANLPALVWRRVDQDKSPWGRRHKALRYRPAAAR